MARRISPIHCVNESSVTVRFGQTAFNNSALVTTRPWCSSRYRSTSKLLRRSATIPDGPFRHNRSRSRVYAAKLNDLAVIAVVHGRQPTRTEISAKSQSNFGTPFPEHGRLQHIPSTFKHGH